VRLEKMHGLHGWTAFGRKAKGKGNLDRIDRIYWIINPLEPQRREEGQNFSAAPVKQGQGRFRQE
jgi:hypothetical protein